MVKNLQHFHSVNPIHAYSIHIKYVTKKGKNCIV